MKRLTLGLAAAGMAGLLGTALAQQGSPAHHHNASPAASNEVERAFREVADRMHRDMDIKFTGNADKDFVAGMIPHHQGAIDMAKIALKHGKDPEIRKLAEAVIREQEKEIAQMRAWQTRAK